MSNAADRRPERIATATDRDLRRKQAIRDKTEHRLRLAEHLPEPDRLLLEQVLGQGVPMAKIARLTGRRPGDIRRRVVKLINHMDKPLYRFLIVHGDLLDPRTPRTAERVIFGVRSLRATADDLGLSLHRVRQHMRTVTALNRLTA